MARIRTLDLSARGLTEPPDRIDSAAVALDISHNALTGLTKSFVASLGNLTSLDLSHNALHMLPEALGELRSLELLDVRFNRLTSLPTGIGKQSLSFQLLAAPQAIGALTLNLPAGHASDPTALYRDTDFPANASSLFRNPRAPWEGHPPGDEVRWLRPHEICAAALVAGAGVGVGSSSSKGPLEEAVQPQLFVGSSDSSDVVQGLLGDCWLLSAMAVVGVCRTDPRAPNSQLQT